MKNLRADDDARHAKAFANVDKIIPFHSRDVSRIDARMTARARVAKTNHVFSLALYELLGNFVIRLRSCKKKKAKYR